MQKSRPQVRAVFFDAVGTILFPAEPVAATYRRAAERLGVILSEETIRARVINAFARQEAIDRDSGWRTDEQREVRRWEAIVTETLHETPEPSRCFRELWEHFSRPEAWRIDPQLQTLLCALDECTLGIASNFDNRLSVVVAAMPILRPLQPRLLVSSRVGWRKPAREFFREVVRASQCEPSEVLFVGDDYENDYIGATEAGMQAVLVDGSGRYNVPNRIMRLGEIVRRFRDDFEPGE